MICEKCSNPVEFTELKRRFKNLNNKTARINAQLLKRWDEIDRELYKTKQELQATRLELLRKIK